MPSFSTNYLIKLFNRLTLAEFSTNELAACMPCTNDVIETKLQNLKLKTWPKQLSCTWMSHSPALLNLLKLELDYVKLDCVRYG